MLTFDDFLNDVDEVINDVTDALDGGDIGATVDTLLGQAADPVIDLLTGDPLTGATDLVNGLIPSLDTISGDDLANVVDTALPILGPIIGGPLGFAPVLSFATDILTGQTIGQLLGDSLDTWFDRDGYLASNPDVANASVDPFLHFLQSGAIENRLPELFDENFYLASNPDVGAAVASDQFSSGWLHFLTNGIREGRSPSPSIGSDIISAVSDTVNDLSSIGLL